MSSGMKNLELILDNLEVGPLLAEIQHKEHLWLIDTGRQDRIRCQRDTQTIFLRSVKKPLPPGIKGRDVHASRRTRLSSELPTISEWLNNFCSQIGGELGRSMVVRLKPQGKIYAHRDIGDYYQIRDRYHLIIKSQGQSVLRCSDDQVTVNTGQVWWLNNKEEYEETNISDDWRIHLIVDLLPTPAPPAAMCPYKHFCLMKSNVNIAPMLHEIDKQEVRWQINTSRQDNIRVQRETNNIFLRAAVKPVPEGMKLNDVHPSRKTSSAEHYPLIYQWVEAFANEMRASLGRLNIVRLKPNSQVYRHIDHGDYYKVRDRYHLVLRSKEGSEMLVDDEKVTMQEGELWWFNNKAPHEAFNNSEEWRIHVIFDLLPNRSFIRQLQSMKHDSSRHFSPDGQALA